MDDTFIKSRIIRGGSAKVKQAMQTEEWDPLKPSVAVSVYLTESTGKVNAAKLKLVLAS